MWHGEGTCSNRSCVRVGDIISPISEAASTKGNGDDGDDPVILGDVCGRHFDLSFGEVAKLSQMVLGKEQFAGLWRGAGIYASPSTAALPARNFAIARTLLPKAKVFVMDSRPFNATSLDRQMVDLERPTWVLMLRRPLCEGGEAFSAKISAKQRNSVGSLAIDLSDTKMQRVLGENRSWPASSSWHGGDGIGVGHIVWRGALGVDVVIGLRPRQNRHAPVFLRARCDVHDRKRKGVPR